MCVRMFYLIRLPCYCAVVVKGREEALVLLVLYFCCYKSKEIK